MRLESKTALVTGGGTGIGKAIAEHLANEGCRVAIAGRRMNLLRETVASWKGEPPMLAHEVDVSQRSSVDTLIDWAQQQLGSIDILINSAGINIRDRSMNAMAPEQWDQVIAINATGTYNTMHAVLPSMRRRREGLIVNISSIAGKRASALGGVAYAASKFAVTALSSAASNELADDGVRITTVFPGEVDTPILDNRPLPVTAERRATMLQPEDVAELVLTIACLPARAHVPEVVVKPLVQEYV